MQPTLKLSNTDSQEIVNSMFSKESSQNLLGIKKSAVNEQKDKISPMTNESREEL